LPQIAPQLEVQVAWKVFESSKLPRSPTEEQDPSVPLRSKTPSLGIGVWVRRNRSALTAMVDALLEKVTVPIV